MKITFRHILIFAFVLVILFSVVAAGKSKGREGPGVPASGEIASVAGVLIAEKTFFDFGTVSMKNGLVRHQYRVLNEGDEFIAVKKVYTSCMCTSASVITNAGETFGPFGMPGHGHAAVQDSNITVGPREAITVEAIFDPAAHGPSGVGLAERTVFLETNSPSSPNIEFSFKAMVTR